MKILLLILACSSNPDTPPPEKTTVENLDQGQKHPPLPANNPVWNWDAKGFVPDFGWYGEHSWMDVRMRVAGHLSAAGRDLARLYAQKSDWKRANQHYQNVATTLKSIPSSTKGVSNDINSLLIRAAQRDASTTKALQEETTLPIPEGNLAPLRVRYLELAREHARGKDVSKEASALQKDLLPLLNPRQDLEIEGFDDFKSRHLLRVRLFEAYLDALDPIGLSERWGYWTSEEIIRQAISVGLAAEKLGGTSWTNEAQSRYGEYAISIGTDPLLWPTEIAKSLRSKDQEATATPEEFGALPTGDSLIDVGAHPGPKAIGDLMKWGLNDEQHKRWLQDAIQDIMAPIKEEPTRTVQAYQKHVQYLEDAKHGSRFYNVKQLRNATVRQLALQGHYIQAHTVLMENFPLHHQDWACPNREGILLALVGRLEVLSEREEASQTLERALKAGSQFLSQVDKAERGEINGPKPPQLKPPKGSKPGMGIKSPNRKPPPSRNAPPAPR
ncbi:MAG: hypothetical protein VX278_22115 [Myxococcota bacterium]|nr:hypothetical protein [Myxococcota bacterium]